VKLIKSIGDFGLAREGNKNKYKKMKVRRVNGNRKYIKDEFLSGKKM
jgi:hypothetical protein